MWTCPSCMAMPVSSAGILPEARRVGACHRSLAARAEELNRHSRPDGSEQISEARRAVVTGFLGRSSCHGSAFEAHGVPGLRATPLPAYRSRSCLPALDLV